MFLSRTLTLRVLLSTQVYKWVPANLMLRVTLRWAFAFHPLGKEILVVPSAIETTDTRRPDGPFGSHHEALSLPAVWHLTRLKLFIILQMYNGWITPHFGVHH